MEKELHTWVVIDSDGDRHEVTARHVNTDGGITNFIREGGWVMHSFYRPRSVTLKEPQKRSGDAENYPTEISRPPAEVNGYRVLAWAEKKRQSGYYPGGIVLVCKFPDSDYPEWITWEAYTKDGGETWYTSDGRYKGTFEAGWESFMSRCRNLAEK